MLGIVGDGELIGAEVGTRALIAAGEGVGSAVSREDTGATSDESKN